MISVVFECVSLSCASIAYGVYAHDGIGLPFYKLLSQLLRQVEVDILIDIPVASISSTIIYLFLLILMAKGYTVTRGRLSNRGTVKLMLLVSAFVAVYTVTFIWQIRVRTFTISGQYFIQTFDPAQVTYIYESVPGYGIVLLRIVAWLWFCYAIYMTLIRYPEKRKFYVAFSISISLWYMDRVFIN